MAKVLTWGLPLVVERRVVCLVQQGVQTSFRVLQLPWLLSSLYVPWRWPILVITVRLRLHRQVVCWRRPLLLCRRLCQQSQLRVRPPFQRSDLQVGQILFTYSFMPPF